MGRPWADLPHTSTGPPPAVPPALLTHRTAAPQDACGCKQRGAPDGDAQAARRGGVLCQNVAAALGDVGGRGVHGAAPQLHPGWGVLGGEGGWGVRCACAGGSERSTWACCTPHAPPQPLHPSLLTACAGRAWSRSWRAPVAGVGGERRQRALRLRGRPDRVKCDSRDPSRQRRDVHAAGHSASEGEWSGVAGGALYTHTCLEDLALHVKQLGGKGQGRAPLAGARLSGQLAHALHGLWWRELEAEGRAGS